MAAQTLDSDPERRSIMDDRTDGDDLDNILFEQRRELMAAQTLESDLEMAFKLQMQEAMTASLALVPSYPLRARTTLDLRRRLTNA
ncbi:hypothetical protein FF2_006373 [Malus domestica]